MDWSLIKITFLGSWQKTTSLLFSKLRHGRHVMARGGAPFAEASTFANSYGGQVGATINS
jgi:hypothetical protein